MNHCVFFLGVVDFDYRGSVGVILFNHSDQDFVVKHGDRVAQGILERIVIANVQEVAELDDTDRGASGFGSTGTSSLPVAEGTLNQHFKCDSSLGLAGVANIIMTPATVVPLTHVLSDSSLKLTGTPSIAMTYNHGKL